MNNSFDYLKSAQFTGDDNHVLFTLLFLLRYENKYFTDEIDVNRPIASLYSDAFGRMNLIDLLYLIQFMVGRKIPDNFVNEKWTIKELSANIQKLPVMTDSEFRTHLVNTKDLANTKALIAILTRPIEDDDDIGPI